MPKRRTCATMEVHERLLRTDPNYKKNIEKIETLTKRYMKLYAKFGLRTGILRIPVVVHVVYNTSVQNISDAQIQSQIAVLNEDFRKLNADASQIPTGFQPVAADARIEFALAVRDPNCEPTDGITRTATNVTSFTDDDDVKFASRGGHDAWPCDKYLNIWVCNLAGGLLGYAQFPGGPASTDGVVINYQAFGNTGTLTPHYDLGRTATHEIGHWLNLRHIWGDAYCGSDFVSDTPTHDSANYGCPTQPHSSTCTGNPREMTMNYMDYTDDACMFMFTAGQSTRMDATLYGARSAIVGSDGLIPPPPTPTIDLWSQDTPEDIGDEPNTVSRDMWRSEDIWVRRQNDGLTNQEHQNPEYRAPGYAPNYVYVRIRNRGCSGGGNATVKLYWAKASTGLGWPAPWDGSVTTPALMGGSIGSKATGNVPGGGFVILEFPWNPPNPANYSSLGGDKTKFCLLSRIETSSSSPFGMTYPEGPYLNANVRNNNNIIWKNITVVDELPDGRRIACVILANPRKATSQFKLVFTTQMKTKRKPLDWGTFMVDIGEKALKQWKDTGAVMTGMRLGKSHQLILSRPTAWIDKIRLRPRELHVISIRFKLNKTLARRYNVFFFDVKQYATERKADKLVGGQRFVVKTVR